MFNTISNHLVKQAGKKSVDVLTMHGGIGAGVGAVYGAVSDNETVMGGAFRGGIVGSTLGVGAKYYGAKYVQGMNNMARHVKSKGTGFSNTEQSYEKLFNAEIGRNNGFNSYRDTILSGHAASSFNGYNSKAFSFAGDDVDWWGGTHFLSGDVTSLREAGVNFNKAKASFLTDKTVKEERKDLFRAISGMQLSGDSETYQKMVSSSYGVNPKDSNKGISLLSRFSRLQKDYDSSMDAFFKNPNATL